MRKERQLGMWPLGTCYVKLIADYSSGNGSFALWPDSGVPEIWVGLTGPYWSGTLDVLLHEALELSFTQIGRRYAPSPDIAKSHAGYLFSMNHEEFSDGVARCAGFLMHAIPALHKEWKDSRKKKAG